MKQELSGYARRIAQARLVLGWERLWRLAWPVSAWIALFAAVALLDVLPRLSSGLHGLILAGFAAGLAWFLFRLRRFKLPSRQDAQRRLEADSGLSHRPLSQLDDKPAPISGDRMSDEMWRMQRKRGLALLVRLRLTPPAPGLPARDPWGLRFAPLLLLAVGLAVGRHDMGDRLGRALDPGIDDTTPPPLLQIWVTPPSYTGLSPLMLKPGYRGEPIRIPAGSKMLAELQGEERDARLVIGDEKQAFSRLDRQSQKLETEISQGRSLSVKLGWWRSIGSWPIEVVPDLPPVTAFLAPPVPRPDGRLQIKLAARDDYAVESLGLVLTRKDAVGGESEIRLPGGGQKEILLDQLADLTAHPWSGLPVSIKPVARDGAGQEGVGEAVEMILPERHFRHPVARAIAGLRHTLIEDPTARLPVINGILAIAGRPDLWGGDLTVCLELMTARARLARDQSETAVPTSIDMLWAAAIRVEQGDLQDARDAVDQAAQALQDALTNGASDAEITRLTQELNAAVNRLLQSLAKQAANNPPQPQSGAGGHALTPDQLRQMLNQMSDLAHSGARDAARQSLDALRNMLSQLSAGGGMSPGAQRLGESLNALQGMGDKQRALLDRAFRRAQQQPGAGDAKSDKQAEDALRQELEQMLEANPEAAEAAPALDQAMRAMNQAGQALQQGNDQAAQTAEGRALDRLQEGARQIGKALEESGQGEGMGGENGSDPLGRNLQGKGTDGNGVKIPSQGDIGKARAILDDLRRRAGDADRPPAERDYLRRLLDKIY